MAEELKPVKRSDKGVVVPAHKAAPYDPENIHLTKAQFIAKQKARKEKELKVAEFTASLENKVEVKEEIKEKPVEVKEEKGKPKGRPKKIE